MYGGFGCLWQWLTPENYSPARATTGSSFAARAAGFSPKNIPIATEKTKLIMQAFGLIENPVFFTYSTARLTATPAIIPKVPPINVMDADSTRNCLRMSAGVAPRAFLIPISCFRSVTVTIIMFIIPIPPTKSEIAAIALSIRLSVFVMEFICSIIVCIEKTFTEYSVPVVSLQ